jgi:hypothetical protein
MKKLSKILVLLNFLLVMLLSFSSSSFGYYWPIGDGQTQQRINGTFGEFRDSSGSNPPYNTDHFHDGVDIPAPQGTTVWGVQDEAVWAISSTWHYVKTDYHDFRHIFPDTSLRTGQSITWLDTIGFINASKHLHFTQEDYRTDWGFEYNPLVQGFSNHLYPFEDNLAPIINYVKLVDHQTQQEFPNDTIRGYVDIIVKTSDRIPYPPNNVDYNNGIYGVGYEIRQSGRPWSYNIQFDFWPYVKGWNINCVYAESSDIDDYYYIATNRMNADTFWNSRNVYDGWWRICVDVYDQSFNSCSYELPIYVHNYLPYIHGDINLNGTPYEIGDAVMFARYFVYGINVFAIDLATQVEATDVNRDGRTLMLADLIFLIKIILGDLPKIWGPFPKFAPTNQSVDFIVNKNNSKITVSMSSEVSLSASVLIFKHDDLIDPPELLCNNKMQLMSSDRDGELRILIWSPNGDVIPSGKKELLSFTCSGEVDLISVEAVDSEIRELKTNIVEQNRNAQPSEFVLYPNYPNPFNPETEIEYSLVKDGRVNLEIYNVLGQRVKTLVDEYQTTGDRLIHWDGKDENGNEVASGIYFYKIQVGDLVQTKKMILLR